MSSFNKIIGYESVKAELRIISDILRNPAKYKELGVNVPKGVMLYGDPGIGKTMMANALIEASGRTSFVIRKNRPDGEFVKYITEMFEKAKETSPSILFLDDMDKFGESDQNRRSEEEYVAIQTGIDEAKDYDVFVIATVNDKELLPVSLTRAGRFDKTIEMIMPSGEDAERIVKHLLNQKKISDDVDAKEIAQILADRSCAELEAVINEAGMYAAYDGRNAICHNDLIRACLRFIFEASESNGSNCELENKAIAIHEAGHAVAAEMLDPGSVKLVSIAEYRGSIKGITSIQKPKGYWQSQELMEHRVKGILGGKAATEVTRGEIDVATISDIRRANNIIRRFGELAGYGFECYLGWEASEYSKSSIDKKVAMKLELLYQETKKIIIENQRFHEAVVEELLEKKTITGKDIARIKKMVYEAA